MSCGTEFLGPIDTENLGWGALCVVALSLVVTLLVRRFEARGGTGEVEE